jgi:hypothetical protein
MYKRPINPVKQAQLTENRQAQDLAQFVLGHASMQISGSGGASTILLCDRCVTFIPALSRRIAELAGKDLTDSVHSTDAGNHRQHNQYKFQT